MIELRSRTIEAFERQNARIEAPNAPNWVGNGEGYPSPSRLGSLGERRLRSSGVAENDYGAFWRRRNGSRCNTCGKLSIFPRNF